MPYKDPIKSKEYYKKWCEKNKNKIREYEKLPRVKKVRKTYEQSEAGKAAHRKYLISEKGRRMVKKRYHSKKWQRYYYLKRLEVVGLTEKEYDRMVLYQNNLCAICRKPPKKDRRLVVDHNHKCCPQKKSCGKCIRGLLCDQCNHMIGLAHDNPEILREAIKYVNRFG